MKMKSKILLLTFFHLSFLIGQDDSTKAVEWGYLDSTAGVYYLDQVPYTGPVIKQLDIGMLMGEFKDGIKHGLWQTLNQIGDPIMIGNFDEGRKNGKFEQWFDDGATRHRELIATFNQDKYVDVYKEWYENGKRSIKGFYVNGKEEGKYSEWYENGKKALKARFINGIPDGWYREWHPNGKKALKIKYENGKENGPWLQWYENGKKEMKINYVNGIPRGKATFWFPDGSLRGEGIVRSEVPGGGWILVDPEGNKKVYK
ncbi:MAG: hypothetical protein CMG60_06260 [Candidatus Marinimicrobia bacterium]|nr:hypothetical protein [Candidatus Neomarinimicrobiota bacterium]